jgi:hypothetical protein
MDKQQREELKAYTIKQIQELTKQLEENAIDKIDRALNSGALSEESDFLKQNTLLARVLLNNECKGLTLQHPAYRKEADNLTIYL